MRTREEIEKDKGEWRSDVDHGQTANDLAKVLEVLLDIRDLLQESNKVEIMGEKTKEFNKWE